jgi:hypothetical protein
MLVEIYPRVMLEGPFDLMTGKMSDDLRTAGLIPLAEPYEALGYPHAGMHNETTTSAVLNTIGTNAIIDWVVVELRDPTDNNEVIDSRSALLRSSGEIVDPDGTSPVSFTVPEGPYYVAIGHRNHFGVITQDPITLSASPVSVDFTNGSVPVLGGTAATRNIGGTRCMIAGDVNQDGVLRYTGLSSDRDLILVAVGSVVPTSSVIGYFSEDVNMNAVVTYTGMNNDRDPILSNIGGVIPTATISTYVP